MKTLSRPATSDRGFATFAGDAPELDAKTVNGIREHAQKMATSLNSMLDFLDEPLKGEFLKVKGEIDTVLAGLPPSDQAPAALDANHILGRLFDMFASAQSLIGNMNEAMDQAKQAGMAMAKADPTAIQAAVDAKVSSLLASGEYLKKDSDELKTLVKAGVDAARDEEKKIADLRASRQEQLTTAGLPTPESLEMLDGSDEDFNSLKTSATERHEFLKASGVKDDRMVTLCYGDESNFNLAKELIEDGITKPKPAGKPNPFIGGNSRNSAPGGSSKNDTHNRVAALGAM